MWFEARRQERKIRTIMVDHKKRAERRRVYYEKIKKDPTEFLQVHGQACKVYFNSSQASTASDILRPWQGDHSILIDRFDARSHLDQLPTVTQTALASQAGGNFEKRKLNYERYRLLVINEFEKVSEEKFLKQIYMEEHFGSTNQSHHSKKEEAKRRQHPHAAIAYKYEDGAETVNSYKEFLKAAPGGPKTDERNLSDDDDDDEDGEDQFDARLDMSKLSNDDVQDLNRIATRYGMKFGDFSRCLNGDEEEREHLQELKDMEVQRASFSGKGARRERRRLKDIHRAGRDINDVPLGMLRKVEPSAQFNESTGSSSSDEEEDEEGKATITYITSFDGATEPEVKKKKKVHPRKKLCRKWERQRSVSPRRPSRRTPTYGSSDSSRSYRRKRERRKSSRNRHSRSSSRRHRQSHRRRSLSTASSSSYSSLSSFESSSSSDTDSEKTGKRSSDSTVLSGNEGSMEKAESDSDLSLLSVRSSLSDSECERREIENTKRRLKRTKRELMQHKTTIVRSEAKRRRSRSKSRPSAAERLKLQTQRALRKIAARDMQEAREKNEEKRRERIDREEELRYLSCQRKRRRLHRGRSRS